MATTVTVNGTDRSSLIDNASLEVSQILGSERDTASFVYRKYGSGSWTPAILDAVVISDGTTKVFGGRIVSISENAVNGAEGVEYKVDCVDYSIDLDQLLVSESYESKTVYEIIADIITNYAPTFTVVNVACTYPVTKIVFNQKPISECLKRLADFVKYDWYVDPDKDIHFFSKYSNAAPFNITDGSGNYVNFSLETVKDGTQIANQVKVRGGTYDAALFTDKITVKGSNTLSFKLPYQFSGLIVKVNSVSKVVGIDNIDDFTSKDVLYNFQDYTIRFPSNKSDGDVIEFSGYPKVRVLGIASDNASIALYGVREKIIEDSSIKDINVARRRAVAELSAFKDQQVQGTFTTYTAGLRSGQLINVSSTIRGCDTDFLIRSVRFYMRTYDTFAYDVELVTTKAFDLIELLAKLLKPEDVDMDESEVAETIKTDIQELTITETITRQTLAPEHTITATITITENIAKDPAGAGVAPDFVLGPYVPTSMSDPKREAVFEHSFTLY